MVSTSDIRKGLCIRHSNDIYKIIEFLHVKPGKGPAFVRTKLKSVTSIANSNFIMIPDKLNMKGFNDLSSLVRSKIFFNAFQLT